MAKRPSFVSARGRLGYPHLTKPDTKFKPGGEYKTRLLMSIEDGQKDIDRITTEHNRWIAEQRALPVEKGKEFVEGDLPFTIDEEAGTVSFSFKLNAKGQNKAKGETWENHVALFNTVGGACSKDIKIGSGTLAKVSYEFNTYPWKAKIGAGVQLRMLAVQIIELVEWGTRDASSFGFAEEEGAFEGTGAKAVAAEQEADDDETAQEDTEPAVKKDGSDF